MKKIEIGGGSIFARGDGWTNIDMCKEADIQWDLNKVPWPIDSNSANEIYSSHCIEHVDDPHSFLMECARIGVVGCNVEIRCPYPYSDLAMVAGHKSVFSLQQVRNTEFHFPKLFWNRGDKRLKYKSHRIQPSERLGEIKNDLPFLRDIDDQIIMKYFPELHMTQYLSLR